MISGCVVYAIWGSAHFREELYWRTFLDMLANRIAVTSLYGLIASGFRIDQDADLIIMGRGERYHKFVKQTTCKANDWAIFTEVAARCTLRWKSDHRC